MVAETVDQGGKWSEEANAKRSETLKGIEFTDNTRAKMAASKLHGAAAEGSPEWDETYQQALRTIQLRDQVLGYLQKHAQFVNTDLDANDPKLKRYTRQVRVFDLDKLMAGIENKSLDDRIEYIAGQLGIT